jgi:stage II sporulation protein D
VSEVLEKLGRRAARRPPLRGLEILRGRFRGRLSGPGLHRRVTRPLPSALAAIAVMVALASSCRTLPKAPPTPEPVAPAGAMAPDLARLVTAPVVRVGIGIHVPRVWVGADSGIVAFRPAGEDGWKDALRLQAATVRPAPVDRVRLLEAGVLASRMLFLPADASEAISVDGREYRGVLEVRADDAGTLTVINVVGLEDYLRGVLPNELSPELFPEIEAHKAQAVAARTYALRHLGDFASQGYDLCATAACQVYRGRSSEQPFSDQAIAETRGRIALYGGRPIAAFYTSTCGGHTEDGANIFPGEPAPYLKGVACVPERSAWGNVSSQTPAGVPYSRGLLWALDVIGAGWRDAATVDAPAPAEKLQEWTSRLLASLGRQGCSVLPRGSLLRRAGYFDYLVGELCWRYRAERLLAPGDPEFLLQVEDRDGFEVPDERMAAALLLSEGVLTPTADGRLRPSEPLSSAEALDLLAQVAVGAEPPGLLVGRFRGLSKAQLLVLRDEVEQTYPIDPRVLLYRSLDGSRSAVSQLALVSGDDVRFVLRQGQVVLLEALHSRLGVAADHGSRYYRWRVRKTPEELAETLARYGSVGRIRDLEPLRIGSSGRVVELRVVGDQGELRLRGLEIRRGLGLRENLFVLERERDASGEVRRFIFTGKGWGHGVGLCQVGAYGMARSGQSYEQILRHYYTGITLADISQITASSLTDKGRLP